MVLAAAIHSACGRGQLAAGLDEIRGPAPSHASELDARGPITGSAGLGPTGPAITSKLALAARGRSFALADRNLVITPGHARAGDMTARWIRKK
jgi:hypothetical protein